MKIRDIFLNIATIVIACCILTLTAITVYRQLLGACPSNGVRPRGGVFGGSRVGETTSRSSATARRKDDAWATEPPSALRVTAAGGRLLRCPAST